MPRGIIVRDKAVPVKVGRGVAVGVTKDGVCGLKYVAVNVVSMQEAVDAMHVEYVGIAVAVTTTELSTEIALVADEASIVVVVVTVIV